MALIVQKYGGTSVGDIQRIRKVAERVVKTYEKGNDVVIILSAIFSIEGLTPRDSLPKMIKPASLSLVL